MLIVLLSTSLPTAPSDALLLASPTPVLEEAPCADLFSKQWCEDLSERCSEPVVERFCRTSCGGCEPSVPEANAGTGYIPEKAPILHLAPRLNDTDKPLSEVMFPHWFNASQGGLRPTLTS